MSARAAWTAVSVAGRLTERAATRASLRELAESIGDAQPLMRERVLRRPPTVFFDYARDAASAFGNANAASAMHAPLAAAIEAIKIIDDIQDDEPHCLASEIGVDAALHVAMDALAWCLQLTSELPLEDDAWRAAAVAIGRGLHETAAGQLLETTLDGGFDEFWSVVDHKTPPLVATALELGALAAGAAPSAASALTRLAIPLGRLLQIGDDCHDALGPDASDWRNPELNLLMRFSLAGPSGDALAVLLEDPSTLRDAQVLLLRDGALGYAIHAQIATLDALRETIDDLVLPNPAPFEAMLEQHRADTDDLLRRSGVSPMLASHVAGSIPAAIAATR